MKTIPDALADIQCQQTAAKFARLAWLRGVNASVMWDGEQYVANGAPCGPSVHGLYEWLSKQPGVLP